MAHRSSTAGRRLGYDETMAVGQARYQDVLDRLAAAGLPGGFTQTGGMCAALEILLEGGHSVLVTDAEDTLSWDRAEHSGWGAGLYSPDRAGSDGECLAFRSTDDGSAAALVPLVHSLLRGYVTDLSRPA